MKLQDTHYDNTETGCCALINPEDWDGKEFNWDNKTFVKDHIRALFHMPVNFGTVIGRLHKKVETAEGYADFPLALSDEVSMWGSDIYIATDREVSGAENVTISGTFLTKVFEGPYRNIRIWIKEMDEYVESRGKKVQKLYFFYTACPKCSKKFGKNYVVLFAQIY